MEKSQTISKLPEELRANYRINRKGFAVIEQLRVAAALKLWNARGYRDIKFDVPMSLDGKTVFVKVLAKNAEGVVVGVECASAVRSGWLRERVALLRGCLPPNCWIVAVFPASAGERAKKAAKLVDEVWVIGKNGTVEQMMFMSVFGKG